MKQLIIGGARSGKSNLAQNIALQHKGTITVVATAQAGDQEMAERIAKHQADRPSHWQTMESPIRLPETLKQLDKQADNQLILVDCLTLWITNLLLADENPLERESLALMKALETLKSQIIFVTNETGQGVIPMDPLSRRFVDEAGRLHQQLAANVDRVIYCIAGLPQILKGPPLS